MLLVVLHSVALYSLSLLDLLLGVIFYLTPGIGDHVEILRVATTRHSGIARPRQDVCLSCTDVKRQ